MPQNKRPLPAIIGSGALIVMALLPRLEGEKLTSYPDIVGVWTNCAGNTHNVRPHMTLTKEQCAQIDADNAAEAAEEADRCVPLMSLNPSKRAAVVLFTINEGGPKFCSSTYAKKLKAHDPTACEELWKWDYAGGHEVPGLLNRRKQEYPLCKGTE